MLGWPLRAGYDLAANMYPWLVVMRRSFEHGTPGNETKTIHHLKVKRRAPVGILVHKVLSITRMHSSRMFNVRCSSHLLGWGGSAQGGCVLRGCLARGVCVQGVSAWEGCQARRMSASGVSEQGGVCLVCLGAVYLVCPGGVWQTPPRGQNSWHTLMKTLPLCNFVCGRQKSELIVWVTLNGVW